MKRVKKLILGVMLMGLFLSPMAALPASAISFVNVNDGCCGGVVESATVVATDSCCAPAAVAVTSGCGCGVPLAVGTLGCGCGFGGFGFSRVFSVRHHGFGFSRLGFSSLRHRLW